MHAKSDSEVTSLAPSSPPRSPRRPAYFVQSPSRDSHDGESKHSFRSTPILSPSGSPVHSAFTRSRESSQSLSTSGGGKHGSRKILPQPNQERSHREKGLYKGRATFSVIEEEPEDVRGRSKASQIYMLLLILLICIAFIGLFILVFWLICRPHHPHISVKNVVFHNFFMGQGSDATGVPSNVLSLNCTVQLTFDNPSKYFGAHISLVAVTIKYSELGIATGRVNGYFQPKRSQRIVSVVVPASKVPIYGAGNGLSDVYESNQGIPLQMSATIRSQYHVVGRMVKSTFVSAATCDLVVDPNSMALLIPLRNSCTFDPAN